MQMNRVDKDTYYLEIAKCVSRRSTCLKRHYGAVLVKNDEIVATGYNGSPRGEENCCDKGTCNRMHVAHNTDYSNCHSVHAEQNAMLSASRTEMLGSILYLDCEEPNMTGMSEVENSTPCPLCMRMLKNAGVVKYVNRLGSFEL